MFLLTHSSKHGSHPSSSEGCAKVQRTEPSRAHISFNLRNKNEVHIRAQARAARRFGGKSPKRGSSPLAPMFHFPSVLTWYPMGRLRTLLTMKVICPFGLQEIALTMLIISDHNCLQRGRPAVKFTRSVGDRREHNSTSSLGTLRAGCSLGDWREQREHGSSKRVLSPFVLPPINNKAHDSLAIHRLY